MKIYPAVDIKDGACVRLKQGLADDKTVYYKNPVDAAKFFADSGSDRIHVVDLDGAFDGRMRNLKIIEAISSLGMFVELGGGMRDIDAVRAALDAGVDRAIIGTLAAKSPEKALNIAGEYGGKVAVGIDAKNGMVAVHGWVAPLNREDREFLAYFRSVCKRYNIVPSKATKLEYDFVTRVAESEFYLQRANG